MKQSPIGVLGLGLLGAAIAERLLDRGHAVLGYDVHRAALNAAAARGVDPCESARDLARDCERIFLVLPTHDDSAAVIADVEGELVAGKVILDATTGAPAAAESLARRLAPRGVAYLEACTSGSSQQARAGEVQLLVGGEASAVERCRDLFESLGRTWLHAGPAGAAAKLKLATNLVLGLHRAALAEGLAFAEALGLDLDLVLRALKGGAAYSRAMDAKGEKMIRRDYAPAARLRQHHKDVLLILDEARNVDLPLPFSRVHEELLRRLIDAGWGDADNAAVFEGITQRPSPHRPVEPNQNS